MKAMRRGEEHVEEYHQSVTLPSFSPVDHSHDAKTGVSFYYASWCIHADDELGGRSHGRRWDHVCVSGFVIMADMTKDHRKS
jgi:hypothetical protein